DNNNASANEAWVSLMPHPSCDDCRSWAISAEIKTQGKQLQLSYRLSGDLSRLKLPAPAPSVRRDELWKHSCFELFTQAANATQYDEYNFSADHAWAHYQFNRYREAAALPEQGAPQIHTQRSETALLLRAVIALPSPASTGLKLGITAVLETRQGQLSYWALHHPKAQPDFHDSAGFVLKL
ncbi:MAG: DOMON-like domain-containing protein, partial [Nevskiales bacterium]